MRQVGEQPGLRHLTNDDPAHACGLRLVSIRGADPGPLTGHLWDKHRIIVCPIDNGEFRGLRVTPNVYTTLEELDRFAEALGVVARNGLPG
jgi:selenocysteine lyase/cysteine desulfurase